MTYACGALLIRQCVSIMVIGYWSADKNNRSITAFLYTVYACVLIVYVHICTARKNNGSKQMFTFSLVFIKYDFDFLTILNNGDSRLVTK